MTAISTYNFRIHNAEQFLESFGETDPSRYFLFIGKVTGWANDSAPTTPVDTIRLTNYDIFREMIAMKRINSSDVTHAVLRYNWTTDTAYTQYTCNNASLFPTVATPTSNTTFYVLTEDMNVYKCIDNNRGGRSTVKPTGTGTAIISTADGYRWKFMYKITAAESLKFLTTNYMPVKYLSANDGSAQWSVQQAAANGSIEHLVITSNGSGYLSTTNTFSSITNSTVLLLANNASGTDNIYNNSTIFISDGLGAGQLRRIVDYVGSTKTLTVNGAFTTTPNTSSRYVIGPNVIIRGNSGASSATRATAYVSNCGGGQVRKITMVSTGLNYSQANVTIVANTSWGSGAAASAVISPRDGHGKNPIYELNGTNILINTKIIGNEDGTFPSNNDFRIIGIIRDPKLRDGSFANASVIDVCDKLNVNILSGDFTADEIITGQTSGVKARFVRFANTNTAWTKGTVHLIGLTPTGTGTKFVDGETVIGSVSAVTANVVSSNSSNIKENTGRVLYVEHRTPISRQTNQIEDMKFLFKF